MRKVLHVFKILFLLAWLAFVILCCHSCLMAMNSGAAGSEGAAAGEVDQAVRDCDVDARAGQDVGEEARAGRDEHDRGRGAR